jgi:hypothetical protein
VPKDWPFHEVAAHSRRGSFFRWEVTGRSFHFPATHVGFYVAHSAIEAIRAARRQAGELVAGLKLEARPR